jgi:hypothetical protein
MANASNTTAPTQFVETKLEKYAYRRFGKGDSLPLLCLQHFTGTLDNWDPAVTGRFKDAPHPARTDRNPIAHRARRKRQRLSSNDPIETAPTTRPRLPTTSSFGAVPIVP